MVIALRIVLVSFNGEFIFGIFDADGDTLYEFDKRAEGS